MLHLSCKACGVKSCNRTLLMEDEDDADADEDEWDWRDEYVG